jgi:putative SOS response-associated peptidase YedK
VHNLSQKARLSVKQYLRRSPDRGRRDGEAFGVAGIWENWRDPFTSKWERTFAVITVPANSLIAPIHDRMLAILANDQFTRWLSAEENPHDRLVPFPDHCRPTNSLPTVSTIAG